MSRVALYLAALILSGCATPGVLDHARTQFYSGQPDAALETLAEKDIGRRNQLLLLLDRGLITHTAGRYTESIEAFLAASKLIEELDFVSVSEQTASLITNEWATSYKGEYSERLWVHTFQMMNFLLLDNPEGAAVEARQALSLYAEHGKSLKNDWFSRALIGLSLEAVGQRDSAHIEYRKLFDDLPYKDSIAAVALRNATMLGRQADAERFAAAVTQDEPINAESGELVVFIATGSIPEKRAGDLIVSLEVRVSFPVYPELSQRDVRTTTRVDGEVVTGNMIGTQLVEISRSSLDARGKTVASKQALRIAAKYNIGHLAGEQDEVLGSIVKTVLFLLEQADTRSWETLPSQLAMLRIPMAIGTHDVELLIDDGNTSHRHTLLDIHINKAGQKIYKTLRTGPGAPNYPQPGSRLSGL